MANPGAESSAKKQKTGGFLDSMINAAFKAKEAVVSIVREPETIQGALNTGNPQAFDRVIQKLSPPELHELLYKMESIFDKHFLCEAAQSNNPEMLRKAVALYPPHNLATELTRRSKIRYSLLMDAAADFLNNQAFEKIYALYSPEQQINELKYEVYHDRNLLWYAARINSFQFAKIVDTYKAAEKIDPSVVKIPHIMSTMEQLYTSIQKKDHAAQLAKMKLLLDLKICANLCSALIDLICAKVEVISRSYEYNYDKHDNKKEIDLIELFNVLLELGMEIPAPKDGKSIDLEKILSSIKKCLDPLVREKLILGVRKIINKGIEIDLKNFDSQNPTLDLILYLEQKASYYHYAFLDESKVSDPSKQAIIINSKQKKPSNPTLLLHLIERLHLENTVNDKKIENNTLYNKLNILISMISECIRTCPSLEAVETNGANKDKTAFDLIVEFNDLYKNSIHHPGTLEERYLIAERRHAIFERLNQILGSMVAHGLQKQFNIKDGMLFGLKAELESTIIKHYKLTGHLTAHIKPKNSAALPLTLVCKIGGFLVHPALLPHFRSGAKAAFMIPRENCLTYKEEDNSDNLHLPKVKAEKEKVELVELVDEDMASVARKGKRKVNVI